MSEDVGPIEPTKYTIKGDDMGHMIIIGVHMRVGPSKEVVALSAQSTWPVPSLKLTCNASWNNAKHMGV